MEYTVSRLAKLAGVSPRTLRYYDEIDLLKPARINSSGYRVYGAAEVDKLQQILFYRELGVGLDQLKMVISVPSFDAAQALREHRASLLARRRQLDLLIANVDRSLAAMEGRATMSDKEKFEGFKKRMLEENETKYGQEVRAKYGEQQVEASNAKFMAMTKEQHDEAEKLAQEVQSTLKAAVETEDPAGELAQKAADLHRQWLCCYWGQYSKEAHAGLAQMYVDDPRFTAYYDKKQPGAAAFLRDAIFIYTGKKA